MWKKTGAIQKRKKAGIQLGLTLIACMMLSFVCPGETTSHWITTWGTAPNAEPQSLTLPDEGLTFRQRLRISQGGDVIRVKLTNELGSNPLSIGQATIALDQKSGFSPEGMKTLSFGGKESIVIPAGAIAISDPIKISLPSFSHLSISLFVPNQPIQLWTHHPLALETNAVAPGNQTSRTELTSSETVTSSYFLKAIDVECEGNCAAIATLGDSITDGQGSTIDADKRWPDVLASRLTSNAGGEKVAIFDEGISGNRLLHDGRGPSVLSRLDRDVLAQSGVRVLIVLIGINDIGHATRARDPDDPVSVEDLSWGLSQLAARAHQVGIKIYAATLTPAGHGSVSGEALRSGLNNWIRTSQVFDGVIDFDAMLRDPQHATRMLSTYDSGDSLHPSDEGYRKMGDSIDLKLLTDMQQH